MQLIMHHHGFLAVTIAQRIVEVLLMQKRTLISQWEIEIVPVEGSFSLRHRGLPFATLRRDELDLIVRPRELVKCVAQDAVLTMLDIPVDLMCFSNGGFDSFFFLRDDPTRADLAQGKTSIRLVCPNLFEKAVAYANPAATAVEPNSTLSQPTTGHDKAASS